MSETISNILETIVNVLFETCYICCFILFIQYKIYNLTVYPFKKEIDIIREKQNILYKVVKKLKFIIDIDKKEKLRHLLKRELNKRIERLDKKCLIVEENDSLKDNIKMPLQNHITFPHFKIYKSNKNLSDNEELLLSNQLYDFISFPVGTSIMIDSIKYLVLSNIGYNNISNGKIKPNEKLRKLFNISEDEKYDITVKNIYMFLKPHIKLFYE